MIERDVLVAHIWLGAHNSLGADLYGAQTKI